MLHELGAAESLSAANNNGRALLTMLPRKMGTTAAFACCTSWARLRALSAADNGAMLTMPRKMGTTAAFACCTSWARLRASRPPTTMGTRRLPWSAARSAADNDGDTAGGHDGCLRVLHELGAAETLSAANNDGRDGGHTPAHLGRHRAQMGTTAAFACCTSFYPHSSSRKSPCYDL